MSDGGFRGCAANEDAPGDVFWSTDKSIRVVNGGPSLPHRQLQALAGQAAREYAALRAVLGEDVGRVTVWVHDSGIARHFPPATIRIPTRLLRKSTVITAHEITHLLSQGWASQVLKEGLASYLQARFGGQRGWPNYRRTLHGAARYWLRESESVMDCRRRQRRALSRTILQVHGYGGCSRRNWQVI